MNCGDIDGSVLATDVPEFEADEVVVGSIEGSGVCRCLRVFLKNKNTCRNKTLTLNIESTNAAWEQSTAIVDDN
jgi:hypothetical protein